MLKGLLLGLVSLYTLKIEVYSSSRLCCVVSMWGEAEKRGTETPTGPGFSWVSLAGSHVYPSNRHVFCSHLGQVYRQK